LFLRYSFGVLVTSHFVTCWHCWACNRRASGK